MLRNNGGKAWAIGEKRFWGTPEEGEKSFVENFKARQNFLKSIGLIDETFYYDYSLSQKNSLKYMLQTMALMPMTASENWIQGANVLGLLTDEEFASIKPDGSHDISQDRINSILYDVRRTHGRGYSPNTERMLSLYSMGRSFQLFKKYILTNWNERFGQEMTNMYGEKEIGSMSQFGHTVYDVLSGKVSLGEFKAYYQSLPPHKQEALRRAINGMGMMVGMSMMLAMMADDDDDENSEVKRVARVQVQKAYNDVMKYYQVNKAGKLVTPYPYYTAKKMGNSMSDVISLRDNQDSEMRIKG